MNPCDIELGTATYLGTVVTIPTGTQFLAAVNATEMDPEKPAVVASAENVEFRSQTCFVATVEVAIRTPATAYTRAEHSALVERVSNALNNQPAYVDGFNRSVSGVALIGSTPVNFRAPSFEDRAWVNVVSVGVGIVTF
jgi:hypothetical protein